MYPSEALFVKLPDASKLTDYQFCYWHALETEARQKAYGERARAKGLTVVDVDTEDLNAPGTFENLLASLGIEANEADLARIEALRSERVNEKTHHSSEATNMPVDMDAEEAVIDALAGRSV